MHRLKFIKAILVLFLISFLSGNVYAENITDLIISRNEIFARHGRHFNTYELYMYFKQFPWYQPDRNYTDKRLTPDEWKKAKDLSKKEKALLKKNYPGSRLNFDNIWNLFQFGSFSNEEREKLTENGFVATPADWHQFFTVYNKNYYYGVANFITTDSMLQLYHMFIDYLVRDIEKNYLFNRITDLCLGMISEIRSFNHINNPLVRAALDDLLIYFNVPLFFLLAKTEGLSESLQRSLHTEVELCENASSLTSALLISTPHVFVDYTQFTVRGHYTRSENLKKYFKAMMWLGIYPFPVGDTEHIKADRRDVLKAVLISYLLFRHEYEASTNWRMIDEILTSLVGPTDDITPAEVWKIIGSVWKKAPGKLNITELSDEKKLIQVKELITVKFRKKTKIKQRFFRTEMPQSLKFIGQRYVPDAEILQELTHERYRPFPKGLDVIAALGSPLAETLALRGETWDEYLPRLNEFKRQFSSRPEAYWDRSLIFGWLDLLKLSWAFNWSKVPQFFSKADAWNYKSINTSLASWAELNHDMILYKKQACAAECGMGGKKTLVWFPGPPKGYIEPNLEFWTALRGLLVATYTKFKEWHVISERWEDTYQDFLDEITAFELIVRKEIEKAPISFKDYGKIADFGHWLEHITADIVVPGQRWNDVYGFPDKRVPVIADVFTGGQLQFLEEAVGSVFDIFVVVEIDGKLKLTRGGVFSYYEFISSKRLTDEEWHEILDNSSTLALESPGAGSITLLDWVFVYTAKERHQVPKPQVRAPEWSAEPGWYEVWEPDW